MCLDGIWLLVGLCFLLGLSELLDETHWSALETSVEPTAGSGVEDVDQFIGGDIEKSVNSISATGLFHDSDAVWSRSQL